MKRKTWRINLNSRNREGKGVKGWGGLFNYMYIYMCVCVYLYVCFNLTFTLDKVNLGLFPKKSLLKVFGCIGLHKKYVEIFIFLLKK